MPPEALDRAGDDRPLPAAVLWDMDGTLVDTEPYWIECELELVAAHGGTWSVEQAHSLVGSDLAVSGRRIAEEAGLALAPERIIDELLAGVIARIADAVPWRPGARELLAGLRQDGVPTALVTMSFRNLADAVLSRLPAGSFDASVTGDEVSRGKPDPEPYLAAARRLGVRAADCVAIEDSPTGVTSALAAGTAVVAVQHLVPLDGLVPSPVLTSLDGVGPADLLGLAVRA